MISINDGVSTDTMNVNPLHMTEDQYTRNENLKGMNYIYLYKYLLNVIHIIYIYNIHII